MANAILSVRINPESKKAAEQLYESMGLSLQDAIKVFIEKSLYVGGLPFELRYDKPNEKTIAAMIEADETIGDPKTKLYDNLDEMWGDLDKE